MTLFNPFNLFSKELLNRTWTPGEFSGKGDPFTIPERLIAMNHGKCSRLVHGMLIKYGLMLHYLEPGASVLDACCGTGFGTKYLQENGFVTKGIDTNDPILSGAAVRGIDVIKHNLFRGEVGNFDGITLVDAIEHFQKEDQLPALKILIKQLNNNGVMLVDTPLVKVSYRQSSKHPWCLSWEDLETLVRQAGDVIKLDRFLIDTFNDAIPVLYKLYKKPDSFSENADQIIVVKYK